MKRRLGCAALLCLTVNCVTPAQRLPEPPREAPSSKDKESKIPQRMLRAQYVMVVSQREADFNQRPDMEDVRVVSDTEAALRKWGRFRIAYNRLDADLIISVYRAGTRLPGGIGAPRGPSRGGGAVGTEIASAGDTLAVYDAQTGSQSAALWRKSQKDGLSAPGMPLIKLLREEMEAAKVP